VSIRRRRTEFNIRMHLTSYSGLRLPLPAGDAGLDAAAPTRGAGSAHYACGSSE
jgi:hypothetical protein